MSIYIPVHAHVCVCLSTFVTILKVAFVLPSPHATFIGLLDVTETAAAQCASPFYQCCIESSSSFRLEGCFRMLVEGHFLLRLDGLINRRLGRRRIGVLAALGKSVFQILLAVLVGC